MKDEKIIERIKKLLRLAEDNSSPNEAMIAAKRARSLMDQHQIRHIPITKDGELHGIVNMLDLVMYRLEQLEKEAEALSAYVRS